MTRDRASRSCGPTTTIVSATTRDISRDRASRSCGPTITIVSATTSAPSHSQYIRPPATRITGTTGITGTTTTLRPVDEVSTLTLIRTRLHPLLIDHVRFFDVRLDSLLHGLVQDRQRDAIRPDAPRRPPRPARARRCALLVEQARDDVPVGLVGTMAETDIEVPLRAVDERGHGVVVELHVKALDLGHRSQGPRWKKLVALTHGDGGVVLVDGPEGVPRGQEEGREVVLPRE